MKIFSTKQFGFFYGKVGLLGKVLVQFPIAWGDCLIVSIPEFTRLPIFSGRWKTKLPIAEENPPIPFPIDPSQEGIVVPDPPTIRLLPPNIRGVRIDTEVKADWAA